MKREYGKRWIVTPQRLPAVIRRCPKCGQKTEFENSGRFQINANGRLLDVWLIYRCQVCETSWNMAVYERVDPKSIDREEYEGFLRNDRELAVRYGCSRRLFARNKAEVVNLQKSGKTAVRGRASM